MVSHHVRECGFLFGVISLMVHFFGHIESNTDGERRICVPGIRPKCCPGWHNAIGAPCSIPSCAGNCGDRGRCIKPDTCLCEDRRLRFDCELRDEEKMQADQAFNTCPEHCRNRGKCVSNKCQCDLGYTGDSCEVTIESACFAKLQRGLCVNPVHQPTSFGNVTTLMSKELCCNTFGIAWGQPCQPCQLGYCGRGFREMHGTCRDINECQIPGICRGGHCTNLEGSYSCKCPSGYEFSQENLECIAVENSCSRNEHRCSPGGKCVPGLYGEFKCLCNWHYVAAEDQKSCVPRKKMTFDFCSLYKRSICPNGVCVTRDNSYECICNEGFEASTDRKSCRHKIDMCAIHRGYLCQNGECVSSGRDFYCKCNRGFVPSFDRRRCINRCEQLGPSACLNGQCVAEPSGDYHCQCSQGFQLSRDGKSCIDVEQIQILNSYENEDTLDYLPSFLYRRNPRLKNAPQMDGEYQQDYLYQDQEKHIMPSRIMSRLKLSRKPPCEQPHIVEKCAGGFCLNLGGATYICECLPGYASSHDNRSCVKAAE